MEQHIYWAGSKLCQAVILRYSSVFWSDFIRVLLRLTSLSLPNKLMGDKKKAGALFVRLVSTAGTGFFYVKKKTKTLITNQTKLEFRKFDPRVNCHVLFKEEKMK